MSENVRKITNNDAECFRKQFTHHIPNHSDTFDLRGQDINHNLTEFNDFNFTFNFRIICTYSDISLAKTT